MTTLRLHDSNGSAHAPGEKSLQVSAEELASWMGITPETLEQLARRGEIPGHPTEDGYKFEPTFVQERFRRRMSRDASPPVDLVILQELTRGLKNKGNLTTQCEHLIERLGEILQASSGAIYVSDAESLIRRAASFGMDHVHQERAAEGLALWVMLNQQCLLLPSFGHDDEIVLPDADADVSGEARDALAVPVALGGKALGVLVLSRDRGRQPFTQRDLSLVLVLADQLALAIERARAQEAAIHEAREAKVANQQLHSYAVDVRKSFNAEKQRREELAGALTELERTYLATVEGFAVAVEAKDEYTAGHLLRVTRYGLAMMELIAPELAKETRFKFGFLLHDIGKLGIPDAILTKEGPLTDEEWTFMRRHPEIGHQITSGIPFLSEANDVVIGHHERWDGGGYPRGLTGEEIPLGARVFPIADSFDAMTSDRPYRTAMTIDDALTEVKNGSGTQFWPEAVDAFLSLPRERLEAIARGIAAERTFTDA